METNQFTHNRNMHGYGNMNQQTNYRPTNFNHSNSERSNRQVPYCDYCKIMGHSITDCRKLQKLESTVTCAYCKVKGHLIKNCFKIKEMENNRKRYCSFCRNTSHSSEECFKKPNRQQRNSGNE